MALHYSNQEKSRLRCAGRISDGGWVPTVESHTSEINLRSYRLLLSGLIDATWWHGSRANSKRHLMLQLKSILICIFRYQSCSINLYLFIYRAVLEVDSLHIGLQHDPPQACVHCVLWSVIAYAAFLVTFHCFDSSNAQIASSTIFYLTIWMTWFWATLSRPLSGMSLAYIVWLLLLERTQKFQMSSTPNVEMLCADAGSERLRGHDLLLSQLVVTTTYTKSSRLGKDDFKRGAAEVDYFSPRRIHWRECQPSSRHHIIWCHPAETWRDVHDVGSFGKRHGI